MCFQWLITCHDIEFEYVHKSNFSWKWEIQELIILAICSIFKRDVVNGHHYEISHC